MNSLQRDWSSAGSRLAVKCDWNRLWGMRALTCRHTEGSWHSAVKKVKAVVHTVAGVQLTSI